MFEILSYLSSIHEQLVHVSLYTGLSVTLLVVLGALAYLEPTIRVWCIRAAIAVFVGYVLVIYGHKTGVDDCKAEWNAANARAAAEAQYRDSNVGKKARAEEWQDMASLTAQQKRDQELLDALEKADATCHPITRGQLR